MIYNNVQSLSPPSVPYNLQMTFFISNEFCTLLQYAGFVRYYKTALYVI